MNYTPFPQFVFRSPLLPFNHLKSILDDKDAFLEQLAKPQIQEAIFIASPVLYKELQKLIGGIIKDENEINRLQFSLERYLSRMSTRCTPFGLFAGCALGTLGDKTSIVLKDFIRRTTRLDMYYLNTLYDHLIQLPNIKSKIQYYPNTSLYRVGKRFRYIETIYINTNRKYQIAEVEYSSYINKVLKIAENGTTVSKIADYLTDEDILREDAIEFIEELIEAQLLVSELNQSVIGDDYFRRIIKLLETTKSNKEQTLLLKDIDELLTRIDCDNIDLYENIIAKIRKINIPYEEKFLFQVDMIRETLSATICNELIDELKSAITFLNKITVTESNNTLAQFKQDFYSRYEDREVPFMEALDPELGIGYPSKSNSGDISPLIDNLFLPQKIDRRMIKPTGFQTLLFRKAIECLSRNEKEIVFIDDDVRGLVDKWDDLPPTLYTMFEVINNEADDNLILLKSVGGSSGANLLARFAHTDSEIKNLVKNIAIKEQELMPDSILAEIVHSPEARVGNILSRPHIRDYELLYMSNSDLSSDKLIVMSDLVLSVKHGRLVMHSKKLNKEIIPRLTTAHNYQINSMPVYRFLCDMQMQTGRNGLYFSWGHLGSELSFRPRLKYKNTILSLAEWTVKTEDIKDLFTIKSENDLISAITEWRNSISLPDYVLMPDGDNQLFVDWKSAISIRSLFSIIKTRQMVQFKEFIFDPNHAIVKGKDGNSVYLNECIVAFHKD